MAPYAGIKQLVQDVSEDTVLIEELSEYSSSSGESQKATWATTQGIGLDRNGVWGMSGIWGALVSNIGVLLLMALCPLVAIYTYQINAEFDGSCADFFTYLAHHGLQGFISLVPHPNLLVVQYLACFGLLQAALMVFVPGKKFSAPITPQGNTPVYPANGVQCYLITLVLFFVGWRQGWFDPGLVYDNFGPMLTVLNAFSYVLVFALYAKGMLLPCSTDSGTTGSVLWDVFWGTELHPTLGRSFYIKQWTNCRMGMMGWGVFILCFAAKQYQTEGQLYNSMLVSVLLMQVYIFKFFVWETGYLCSMDICHDRAGFYIVWGCLVWVSAIYTAPAMYLVNHLVDLHPATAAAILLAGLACIWINYDCDRQRQVFRSTGGKAKVWGAPPRVIRAWYTTASGHPKASLLLASGWWGVSRHLHYVPEILGSVCWTLPCLFDHFHPYFYVIFLSAVLSDRLFRDDARCKSKYGIYWDQYCKLVPYKVIPGVF